MTTQRKLLLDHLRKVGSISQMEALLLYRVAALPRRISDLEECGYVIARERKTDNTGRAYVRYYLVEEDDAWVAIGDTVTAQMAMDYAMDMAA